MEASVAYIHYEEERHEGCMSLVIKSCLIFDESKSGAYGPIQPILLLSGE